MESLRFYHIESNRDTEVDILQGDRAAISGREDDQPNLWLQSVSMLPTRTSAIQEIQVSAMSLSIVAVVM